MTILAIPQIDPLAELWPLPARSPFTGRSIGEDVRRAPADRVAEGGSSRRATRWTRVGCHPAFAAEGPRGHRFRAARPIRMDEPAGGIRQTNAPHPPITGVALRHRATLASRDFDGADPDIIDPWQDGSA